MTYVPPKKPIILITGGTGFAGSHLVEHLLDLHAGEVHVTTIGAPQEASTHLALPLNQVHTVNLVDREEVNQLLIKVKPDQIYHLAAMAVVGTSFETAEKTIVDNILIQLHMLDAIKEHAPKSRVLIVGSGQEYDVFSAEFKANPQPFTEHASLGPANPYGVSKVAQDLLGLSYHYSFDLDVVRVRPFNHIGERQSPQFAVSHFAQQIAQAELGMFDTIKVGNLSAIRDFTDVKDIAKGYRILMERGVAGEVYNLGSGQGHTMQEMLDQLIELAKVPIKVEVDSDMLRPVDLPLIVADITKIKELGWTPGIPMAQTLARVLEYWRQHP